MFSILLRQSNLHEAMDTAYHQGVAQACESNGIGNIYMSPLPCRQCHIIELPLFRPKEEGYIMS